MPRKEFHYFNNEFHFRNKEQPLDHKAYIDKFNNKDVKFTLRGEATPDYCFLPAAIERIYDFNLQMKLIMLVRDPVKRAISHYSLQVARGKEKLPFKEAIDKESKRHHILYSYCKRGHYSEQLDYIHRYFNKNQVLVLRIEDLQYSPQSVYNKTLDFLNLPNFKPNFKIYSSNPHVEVPMGEMEILSDYFRSHNASLYNEYDIKIDDWC